MNSYEELLKATVTTTEEFSSLGLGQTAYVRQTQDPAGQTVWAIFSANGDQLGAAPSRDVAFAAIVQYELEPMSVH